MDIVGRLSRLHPRTKRGFPSLAMSENDRPDTDLNAILNFDALRILVLQVNLVSDEHVRAHLDAAPSMQTQAQPGSSWELTRHDM